jgi:hypothetical protein
VTISVNAAEHLWEARTTELGSTKKAMVNKTKINKAFRLMRKAGLIAKQNYWCCQGCAGCAITNEAVQLLTAGKTVKGCCFYHKQDEDDRKEGYDFHLAYGTMQSSSLGQIGTSNEEIGQIVAQCLREAEVPYEWDGKGNTRIMVKQEVVKQAA